MSAITRKPPAACSQCRHFAGQGQNSYGLCRQKKQVVLAKSKRACCTPTNNK